MRPVSKEGAQNRNGCFAIAALTVLVLLLVIAMGLGWLGRVDTGKLTDMPIPDGNRT